MSDWDAAKYHRISDPQHAWGLAVASRLMAVPGEWILDLGCGTGRLTLEIARRPGITVVGFDRSASMLKEAATRRMQTAGDRMPMYVRGDGAALPFINAFDAIFSTATFHWIPDHDELFRSLYRALKRGGRIVAQCGGAGNLVRLYGRASALMQSADYAPAFVGWSNFNHFENIPDTEDRLARAGFEDIQVSLVSAPVSFDNRDTYSEFVAAVCLRHHLDRLSSSDRDRFLQRVTEQATGDDPPLTLDYWRLNIFARKAAG